MTLIPLNLTTLSLVDDGRIEKAFMQELRRAVFDCRDRPTEKKKRVVSLEATISPLFNTNTMIADDADVNFKIKAKIPTRESQTVVMRMNARDQLIFSDTDRDVNQATFDDVDPETGRVDRKSAAAGD